MKPFDLSAPVVENPEKSGIVAIEMTSISRAEAPASEQNDAQLLAAASAHLYPNYAQPQLVIERGEGSYLFDCSGRRYLDLFAGIAVSTLGHGHPRLTNAIAEQAKKLIHLSNHYYNEPNTRLVDVLCELSGMPRAFFCNSGTEANEAALKLARRYFYDQGQTERYTVIAFHNSFHGRTLGALAATGQQKYRTGFGPLSPTIHVAYGDIEAVRAVINDQVAAIIVEPIQGEGGVVVPPAGFLAALRQICDQTGALLIADEIQTGVGRTGTFLALQHEGIVADIVTLAKGLGGGVPIGAMLCGESLSKTLVPGSHGTTFGGNPLASAAALAVLGELVDAELMPKVEKTGQALEIKLKQLVQKHSCLSAHRGQGLLQALVLTDPNQGGAMLSELREAGVLLTFAGGTALRITPPLTISDEELEEGLTLIDQVLEKYS